jgi:hypothetical protein
MTPLPGRKTPEQLIAQFAADGYFVDPDADVFTLDGRVGIRATSSEMIGPTEMPKRVFYVEGNGYQMGYLMGRLANVDVVHMCIEFVPNIMFSFLGIDDPVQQRRLQQTLLDVGYWLARPIRQDVPQEYLDEIRGLSDGCRDCEPSTPVSDESLWLLNFGFDGLMAFGYTGRPPIKKLGRLPIDPARLRIPVMCNGFCARGQAPDGPFSYMGRDFQFSTGDVFQRAATTLIRVPDQGLPTASVIAPGMVGAIAAVNDHGVGVGVDMLPGANCDSFRPGLDSLVLMRHASQYGATASDAVSLIRKARRGVSWIYVVGEGDGTDGFVVEAGRTADAYDGLGFMPADMHAAATKACPDFDGLVQGSARVSWQDGMTVRPMGYEYPKPDAFLDPVNRALIDTYRASHPQYQYRYDPQDFAERGRLNKTPNDRNCPGPFYFAPQRETRPDLVLATNGAISPHMRPYGMADWTTRVSASSLDNIQFRYDCLNAALLSALDKGYLTYDEAKKIISDSDTITVAANDDVIGGAVSLIDLRNRSIESHYGYKSDGWIKLRLTDYV